MRGASASEFAEHRNRSASGSWWVPIDGGMGFSNGLPQAKSESMRVSASGGVTIHRPSGLEVRHRPRAVANRQPRYDVPLAFSFSGSAVRGLIEGATDCLNVQRKPAPRKSMCVPWGGPLLWRAGLVRVDAVDHTPTRMGTPDPP